MNNTQTHPTLADVSRLFAIHTDIEFMTLYVSTEALAAMSAAGWIAAVASTTAKPGNGTRGFQRFGQTNHSIIVRRANAPAGRPLPGVLVMDGAPPFPTNMPPAAQDQFCARMWGFAQVADAQGMSLTDLLQDTAALAAASARIAPAGQRRAL